MAESRSADPRRSRRGEAPPAMRDIRDGRVRAVIDAVAPAVDGGRFPAKRIAGEPVRIEAHCFTDGHDKLRVVLRWQAVDATARPTKST